eukprot:TRINITY_DN9277_c0_g1_i1.p1 TRINITY_DN9277_c0_g1~~TRINITY_DN9277_c0_g1_i1.p1  ORF type:complete len:603 (+),score=128.52 TRINITY_DN9277_c0_g1_i1:72-1880(+)
MLSFAVRRVSRARLGAGLACSSVAGYSYYEYTQRKKFVGGARGDGTFLRDQFTLACQNNADREVDGVLAEEAVTRKDTAEKGTPPPGYPDTYYSRTLKESPLECDPIKKGEVLDADVCVIGGGLAGVCTALGLAERGCRVVLLEEKRVAWSASGRNGGFMLAGFAEDHVDIIDDIGESAARQIHTETMDALRLLRGRIDEWDIQCDPQDCGSITLSRFSESKEETEEWVTRANSVLGTSFELWTPEQVREHYRSDKYYHGVKDPTGVSVHPLNMTLGLARAARSRGVDIRERAKVTGISRNAQWTPKPSAPSPPPSRDGASPTIDVTGGRCPVLAARQAAADATEIPPGPPAPPPSRRYEVAVQDTTGESDGKVSASVRADYVVMAGSAHLSTSLHGEVARSVVPVHTYIMVTEPLGKRMSECVTDVPQSVCDDRFALDYYRPLPDGRLLWGGLIQTFDNSNEDIQAKLMRDMLAVYPGLAGVHIDHVWGGQIGIGRDYMPLIGQVHIDKNEKVDRHYGDGGSGVWYATGFAGHGLVPTTMAGELIASSIASGGRDHRWKVFTASYPMRYSGWPFGQVAAQVVYWHYQLLDKFKLWRQERAN